MAAKRVAVVQTGVANVASVLAGLRRCGAEPELVTAAASVERAERLVLPGVGSFAAGMAALRSLELESTLQQRIDGGEPTLAVCLGLQLLCESSEESPGISGLGVVPANVRTLGGEGVRVPQFGWNAVEPLAGCDLLEAGHAYFANSFAVTQAPDGWSVATSRHGSAFIAAMQRGGVLACQFHPELSGPWGQRLLQRWLECDSDKQGAALEEVTRC